MADNKIVLERQRSCVDEALDTTGEKTLIRLMQGEGKHEP